MHRQVMINNNEMMLELLREEEDDDKLLLMHLIHLNKRRNPISNLFLSRKSEGFFEKLIKQKLKIASFKLK